jgi:hypothetical protein
MPAAHAVLFFLATFVASWGGTLIFRGFYGVRARTRSCPACSAAVPAGLVCTSCHYEADNESQLHHRRRSWALVSGGAAAVLAGVGAAYAAVYVYRWSRGGDPALSVLTLWYSAAAAVALFWLIVLIWALLGERSRGRRRCFVCRYDMAGIATMLCPECGWQAASVRDLYRPRRRKRWAMAAVLGMLSSLLVWGFPRYQQGGVPALVPSAVLIAGFEWLPIDLIDSVGVRPEWTLKGRHESDMLWRWQQRWLITRAKRFWTPSQSVERLERVMLFYFPEKPEEKNVYLRAIVRGLTATDPKERSRTAQLAINTYWILYGRWVLSEQELAALRQTAMTDPDPQVRLLAAALLAQDQASASTVAPVLAEVAIADSTTRSFVAMTLGSMVLSPQGRAAVLALARSQDPLVRAIAARCWYRVMAASEPDQEIRTILFDLLDDPDADVASAAAQTLIYSQVPGALEAAVRLLTEGRGNAVELMQTLSVMAPGLDLANVAVLAANHLEGSPDVRQAAEHMLHNMIIHRGDAGPAESRLQELLNSSNIEAARSAKALLDLASTSQAKPP